MPALFVAIGWMTPALAQTNTNLADEIPPLRPPRGELPAGYWEQYGPVIWAAIGGGVLLVLIALWFLTRRHSPPPLAPAIVARQQLERLRGTPEDGLLLSRVSQILRYYFQSTFRLAPGESTTAEFCAELAANGRSGPALAGELAAFLRRADELKFGRETGMPKLEALDQAFRLIAAGEARCAELRAAAAATPPVLQTSA